ncbi:TonB-dependent receptor-like protein [Flavobacterium sp. 103]|uniref:TonB-dependent receptor n=1 Tax=Flavobacterium sp. 103 TaxID=2135624 RepID=UPI000D5CC940|nr:TonB-dependent receptor [Flavobacterium sp. 103]PVX45516.1 TonB-dependent receptor-like protein [Flavobacterium sp. 103]
MKLKFLFFTLFICVIGFSQNKGTITGVLLDKDSNNQSLPFANVQIKGTKIGANTDVEGKYTITIAPGNYTVQFSFVGYETTEVPVTVVANETATVNSSLGSGSYKLKDVVVKSSGGREKETALLLEQKNAVVIKQSIGAQEMSRKGVSDVEEGLTKITGITKVGSRGLFVRGLEDRYNNLLINDLAAPSNNPYNKYIALDLFPTDIVGVIDVYKTFNTNIYGDFAGGTFNIQTTRPSKSITKLSIGIGYTTNNSFSDFLIAENADSPEGFFGLTGKYRKIPSALGSSPASVTLTPEQSLNAYKDSGFNVADTKSPLNTSISFLNSEKFDFENEKSFSYLLSLSFDNDYKITNGVQRNFNNNPSGYVYNSNFVTTDYSYETSFTGLVGLNYNTKKLKLSYNTTYIKTTKSLIQDQFGVPNTSTANNDVLIRTNQLDETAYLNNQLLGEYALTENNDQNIKAGVSYAFTKFAQPDRKFFSGPKSGDTDITTSIAGNNFIRQYLDITSDYYYSGLAEYNYKFGKEEKNKKFSVGYNGYASNMESSYRFVVPTTGPTFTGPINNIDTQLNSYLANNDFAFRESSNATWQAKLFQSANAGYANLLYNFDNKWEVNGGLRVESTLRETQYRAQGSFNDPFIKLSYDNLYFLPSLNVKYAVTDASNMRFSATKTYTLPIIMEAYPIEYINADGTSTRGNPYLLNSENYNVDLKYEIFPSAKELFSVGLFGKKILDPIERTFIANAANTTITTYLNSDQAVLFGAEFDFLYDLGRINENLADFSWGFNTSLMHTQVDVKPTFTDADGNVTTSIETHQKRELQGASKYLINSDLKYQFNFSSEWSNTLSLVYSVFGKRIYAIGTGGLDHIYELPVNQLDFVWGSKVSKNIDLKFSAQNILNPNIKFEQGNDGNAPLLEDPTIRNYKKGVEFSMSLGYTF